MNFSQREKNFSLYLSVFFIVVLFIFSVKIYFHKIINDKSFNFNPNLSSEFNSGLLISFRNDLDKDTSTYRTLWITPDSSNNLKIINEINFVVVPHKNSFWKIDPVRYNFTNTDDYIEYLVAHDFGDGYTPETFQYKFSTYRSKLTFVDKNYVGVSTYIISHDGNKYYRDNTCAVVDLENLTNYKSTENKVTMKDVFSEKSIPIINKYRNQKINLGECSEKNAINTTSGEFWNIGRKDGRWLAQIAKTFKCATYNNYILYNTELYLPQSVSSNNELYTSYKSIVKAFPDTEDVISSPNKDMIGIFTSDKLTIYPYSNGTFGNPALELELSKNETMIMVQWANGKEIKEWTDAIKKYCSEN